MAAQPLSNVYTVLLLVAAMALVLAAVTLGVYMNKAYGSFYGGEMAMNTLRDTQQSQKTVEAELDIVQKALIDYPLTISTAGPGGLTPAEGAAPAPAEGAIAPAPANN